MLDNEKLCQKLLSQQADRNLRRGGRPPSRIVVTLACLACGGVPILILFPFGNGWLTEPPHLAFIKLSPLVLDLGVPLSAIAAVILMRRWAAPAHRRYGAILATVVAALLRVVIYAGAVISDLGHALQREWILSHLLDTVIMAAAIIIALMLVAGSGRTPWRSKSRPASSSTQDPQYPDHSLYAKAGHYRRLPYFRRRARRRDAEQAA